MSAPHLHPFFQSRASAPLPRPAQLEGAARAQLRGELASLLTAAGDVSTPDAATVDTLESLVSQYLGWVTHAALDGAVKRTNGTGFDESDVVAALAGGDAQQASSAAHLAKTARSMKKLTSLAVSRVESGEGEGGGVLDGLLEKAAVGGVRARYTPEGPAAPPPGAASLDALAIAVAALEQDTV